MGLAAEQGFLCQALAGTCHLQVPLLGQAGLFILIAKSMAQRGWCTDKVTQKPVRAG